MDLFKKTVQTLLFCFVALSLHAQDLQKGEVYEGDFYGFGDKISLSGLVKGNAYLLGGQIQVDGEVTGSLFVAGGSVEMSGHVGNSARLSGAQVVFTGSIEENATFIGADLLLRPDGQIGKNLTAMGGSVVLASPVGGNVSIYSSALDVDGLVAGDLFAYVRNVMIDSGAVISGDFTYRSQNRATILDGAVIEGEQTYKPTLDEHFLKKTWIRKIFIGTKVATLLMNFVFSFVVGCLLIRIYRENLKNAFYWMEKRPIRAFLYGALIVVLLPIAALILLITVLGVPFALTLIAVNVFGFYAAKVYSVLFLTTKIFDEKHLYRNLLIGLAVYFSLSWIPYVGTLLTFATLLFGLGGALFSRKRRPASHT